MTFNRFVWGLPLFVHNLILRLTGWRLVMCADEEAGIPVHFVWTRRYPL